MQLLYTLSFLCLFWTVSQSAATGHQRLMRSQSEAIGGGSRPLQQQEQGDDTDLPLRSVADYSSSAASSIESALPDWMNSRLDKDNSVDEEGNDVVNEGEDWGDTSNTPPVGNLRYDQLERGSSAGAVAVPKDPVLLQQPSSYNSNIKYNNRLMQLTPDDLDAIRTYIYNGGGVGGSLLKRGEKLATHLREQGVLPAASSQTTKSNYRVPAESNIVRGRPCIYFGIIQKLFLLIFVHVL